MKYVLWGCLVIYGLFAFGKSWHDASPAKASIPAPLPTAGPTELSLPAPPLPD